MASDSCTVWWAAPIGPDEAPELVALLDPLEQDRLGRFRRDADRARYLAAHALVRLALATALDADPAALRFDRTCRCGEQHGKPRLDGSGPAFSLTHSGALVGVAVHGRPVGLDVEQARPMADLAAVAAHACAPGETVPSPEAFFRLWTRKEALVKATGSGLSTPMSDITLNATGVERWTGADAPDGPVWLHDMWPDPGHHAAVAGLGEVAPPVVEADGNALLRSLLPR